MLDDGGADESVSMTIGSLEGMGVALVLQPALGGRLKTRPGCASLVVTLEHMGSCYDAILVLIDSVVGFVWEFRARCQAPAQVARGSPLID